MIRSNSKIEFICQKCGSRYRDYLHDIWVEGKEQICSTCQKKEDKKQ